jgi:hypothetical protein
MDINAVLNGGAVSSLTFGSCTGTFTVDKSGKRYVESISTGLGVSALASNGSIEP